MYQKYFTYSLFFLIIISFFSCNIENDEFYQEDYLWTVSDQTRKRCNQDDNRKKKIKIIKKINKNLEKGKIKKILRLLANDIEWIVNGNKDDISLAGTYIGKTEVKSYLTNFYSLIKINKYEVQYNLVEENKVNSHIRINGFVPTTNKTFDIEFLYAWDIDNETGLLNKLFIYYCTDSFKQAISEGGLVHISDLKSPNIELDLSVSGAATKEFVQKNVYDHFAVGNVEPILDAITNDLLFILKGNTQIVPFAGVYVGKEGFLQWVSDLFSSSYYTVYNNLYAVAEGNRVDFHFYEELVCIATGKVFSFHVAQCFIVNEDDLVSEFKSYNDSHAIVKAFTPD